MLAIYNNEVYNHWMDDDDNVKEIPRTAEEDVNCRKLVRAAGGKLIRFDYPKDNTVYVCWQDFLRGMALPDLSIKKLG